MMQFNTIEDIYSANRLARERFESVVGSLDEAAAALRADERSWSVAEIVEHVSMVATSVVTICSRLVESAKADGRASKTALEISPEFYAGIRSMATDKFEAPEIVVPKGAVPIAESLQRMSSSAQQLEAMRDDLSRLDLSRGRFPHPYLGKLTAIEWLALGGLHEGRHTAQIERILDLQK